MFIDTTCQSAATPMGSYIMGVLAGYKHCILAGWWLMKIIHANPPIE